jgi:hypothetical protein
MNKKYIYGGIAVLGIMVTAGWNVNLNSQSNKLSAISLANVEALAQEPGDGRYACYMDKTYDSCNQYNDNYYCPCGSI